jgi:hypothetical protein
MIPKMTAGRAPLQNLLGCISTPGFLYRCFGWNFPFGEIVLMQIHADALATKGDIFTLQPHPLFESRFARQTYLSTGAENAVPRQSARRPQRPNHLACRTGESRRGRHLAVGCDLSFRDP